MTISEATGSQSFEVKIKDKTYTFAPLTMKDFGDIERDLKIARRDELKELVGKLSIENLKFIDEEVQKVNGFEGLGTMNGMMRMIRWCLIPLSMTKRACCLLEIMSFYGKIILLQRKWC